MSSREQLFDQKAFFADLRKMVGKSDVEIARRMRMTRQLFSHYVTGRNRLRVGLMFDFAERLGLDELDVYRLLRRSGLGNLPSQE